MSQIFAIILAIAFAFSSVGGMTAALEEPVSFDAKISVDAEALLAMSGATGAPATEETEQTASDSSKGLGLLAAGIVTGLAGIGGGIAVAAGAPAAIAATAENPKSFGKSIIFVALGESIALYGVVISILILNKI